MNNLIYQKNSLPEKVQTESIPARETSLNQKKMKSTPLNYKQYDRILLRREARKKISSILSNFKQFQQKTNRDLNNKSYLHESRHNHAMKRARGPGGRFLTASEIKQLKENEAKEQSS